VPVVVRNSKKFVWHGVTVKWKCEKDHGASSNVEMSGGNIPSCTIFSYQWVVESRPVLHM